MGIRKWLMVFALSVSACAQDIPRNTVPPPKVVNGMLHVWPEPPQPETAFEQDVVRRVQRLEADTDRDARERQAWELVQLISKERTKNCSKPIGQAATWAIDRYFHVDDSGPNCTSCSRQRDDLEPSMILAAGLLSDQSTWSIGQNNIFYPPSIRPRHNEKFSLIEAACITYEAGRGRPMDWFSDHCGPREQAAKLRQRANALLDFCPDSALERWRSERQTVSQVIRDVLQAYEDVKSGKVKADGVYARSDPNGVPMHTSVDIGAAQDLSLARWFDCSQPVDLQTVERLIAWMRTEPTDQIVPFMLASLGPHARNAIPVLIENLDKAPEMSVLFFGPGPHDVEGQCAALEAISQKSAAELSKRCEGYREVLGLAGRNDQETIPRVGWVCPDARLQPWQPSPRR